jgi:sec-independent protein translocase protein TatA
MLSTTQLGVVALLVVILFGTKRLPELGTGLGKAINNFKSSFRDGSELDVTPSASKTDAGKEESK